MIIKHSQKDVIIDIPLKFKKIGLKLSGGADSALLCYLLFKYISEERPDCIIFPVTANQELNPYNFELSEKIVDFCKKEFPTVNVGIHYKCSQYEDECHVILMQKIFLRTLKQNKLLDCHFIGLTTNPPKGFNDNTLSDNTREMDKEEIVGNSNPSFRPLVNIDKKGICELYKNFNLLGSLFLITRSCDSTNAKSYLTHCNDCFPCNERRWGFGTVKNKWDIKQGKGK